MRELAHLSSIGIELLTTLRRAAAAPTSHSVRRRVAEETRAVARDTFSAAPVVSSGSNPVARVLGIVA